MKSLLSLLVHPYPRYGLAAALVQAKCKPLKFASLAESDVAKMLARTLESGLGNFRMTTLNDPLNDEALQYIPIAFDDLTSNPTWVQSAGLAVQGIYLFPSVITIDGKAQGTFDKAFEMLTALRSGKSLFTKTGFSRSFAPTTAKFNQNARASLSEPTGTLFEAVCSAIATLTPIKPAAWINQRNTGIYPDLPLDEMNDALYGFVSLFEEMSLNENDNLMLCKMPKKAAISVDPAKPARKAKKEKPGVAPKSEYKRPRLHNGNYPFAPRDAETFGTAGLLGAIGRWAHSNKDLERGRIVLESLVDCPLYVVNYDTILQAQFHHSIIHLAQENRLSDIVEALTFDTRLYGEIEQNRVNWDSPARKMFAFHAARFLQTFSKPAFRDFLSIRVEYPSALSPLFQEYFMNVKQSNITQEIVDAACALGQWINQAAYQAAKKQVEEEDKNKQTPDRIRQRKARILVALDGMAMGARTPTALTSSIMRETGMLTPYDAPNTVLPFLKASGIGEEHGGLSMETTRQLLMTYMRVQGSYDSTEHTSKQQSSKADPPEDESGSSSAAQQDEGE